ncbi:exodeoxyribonuclease VII small subunit [Streptomyces prasinopilosus]|uniref:exodeoxyribonuclease VII small subunit n=1 Tax=Streptomyces prasinopilosus TaxID=67344 RepID=UPI000A43F5CB|nr:exodeoxyribonuclease VII small subunit [Streptomyces prasinopilosus]
MTSKTEQAEQAGKTGKTGRAGRAEAVAEALGYEQARDELIEVVRRLETGGTTLEESLALWERGEELAKVCRSRLDGARARLDAALAEEAAGEAEDGDTDGTP